MSALGRPRAQPSRLVERHGVVDVEGLRSRAPERRQVRAAAQRAAEVAGQRPDVEAGGDA